MTERAADAVYIRDASLAPVEVLSTVPGAGGRWSAVSMGGGSVRYWNVQTGPGSHPVLRPTRFAALRSVAVAGGPDGGRVVVALAAGGGMWRWEAATGHLLGSPPATRDYATWWADGPTPAPVTAADVDGASVLVTAMADGSLRGWDPVTGTAMGEAWDGRGARSWALASAVLEDGTLLVLSGGADGLIHQWDPRTGTRIGSPIERCGRAMAMTTLRLPDGCTVVCVASGQGRVHRRDVLSGEPIAPAIRTGWQSAPLFPVCPIRLACLPTASGGVVATCVDYRTVQLWDLVSGEHLTDLPRGGRRAGRSGTAGRYPGCPGRRRRRERPHLPRADRHPCGRRVSAARLRRRPGARRTHS
jgi:WD40 repeat protein